jgi:hypothetical protein
LAVDGKEYISFTAILPQRKEPFVPNIREAGWAPELFWTLWGREKFLTLAENQTPSIQPTVCCYTD